MSPDQKAKRLDEIAANVDGARRLVTASRMALDGSTAADMTVVTEAEAICELLDEIGRRLSYVSEDLRHPATVS